MANLVVRVPVTMSAVRSNGTTASYDRNARTGQGFSITLTAETSATIRDLAANGQERSREEMYAQASSAVRDLIRAKNTRINYNGQEEFYWEDQDDYDDPNDPGGGGAVSYGVPIDYLNNLQISVDYLGVTSNAPRLCLGPLASRSHTRPRLHVSQA